MLKKGVLGIFLLGIILISFSLISAVENETTNQDKVNNAYSCLETKIVDRCSQLSTDEKIFAVLSLGECVSELKSASSNNECWPTGNCDLVTTSKAILALDSENQDVDDAVNWITSHNQTTDFNWFIQVDTNEPSACSINTQSFTVNEDKTISGTFTECLSSNTYSIGIDNSQACLNDKYEVTCDKSFTSSLAYENNDVFYISSDSHGGSADGTTEEQINSLCFTENDICNYEGNLWASIALSGQSYDLGSYFPYLETFFGDNENLFPEAFLTQIAPSSSRTIYENKLLALQNKDGYWQIPDSKGKYYDTALALLVTQYRESTQRTKAIDWLLNSQGTDGCWDSARIDSNGFLLYALSDKFGSKNILPGPDGGNVSSASCSSKNGYCMSSIDCTNAGGGQISEASCSGVSVCCDKQIIQKSCSEESGITCDSGEECNGLYSTTKNTFELGYGETCCVGSDARCDAKGSEDVNDSTLNQCQINFGECKSSCGSGETEEVSFGCDSFSQTCCLSDEDESTGSLWWVWVLGVVIFLLVLGILFRESLRPLIFKIKSKFSGGESAPPQSRRPGFPPRGPPPSTRPIQPMGRRIIPQTQQARPVQRAPPSRSQGDVDDVLKKLKEMGK
ncbi:MAG: hypothetical protein NUV97_03400 [archaeon]|nr:hypothetical protein [archaeon]